MNKEKNLSYLVLIRHGQSEWNEKNLFTGWKNPPLTEKGIKEAELAGEKIKNLNIDFSHYFTSALVRAQETGEIILSKLEAEIMFCLIKNPKFIKDLKAIPIFLNYFYFIFCFLNL